MVLKERTTETKDKQAQRNNIIAAKVRAEVVRTSLGPRGLDKMLVDTLGDVQSQEEQEEDTVAVVCQTWICNQQLQTTNKKNTHLFILL